MALLDSFDDPPDDEDKLDDADLWDRHFQRWKSQGSDDTDAADRATNYVEHRRAQQKRLTPLGDKVRADQEREEGGGTYRVGPIEKRERAEAARASVPKLLAAAEAQTDATTVASSPREQQRRAAGDRKRAQRERTYDPAELRHGAGRAAQLRATADNPDLRQQLEADEENLTKAARSLEDVDTFTGRAGQAFFDITNLVAESDIAKRGATADLASMLDTEGMARRGVTGHNVGEKLTTTRPFSVAKDLLAPVAGTAPFQVAGEALAANMLRSGAKVATSMGRTGTARALTRFADASGPIENPTMGQRMARGATAGQTPFALSAAGGAEARGDDPGEAALLSMGEGAPIGVGVELGLAGLARGRRAMRPYPDFDLNAALDDAVGGKQRPPRTPSYAPWGDTPEARRDLLGHMADVLQTKKEATPIRTAIAPEDITVGESARSRRADQPMPSAYEAALARRGGARSSERPVRGAVPPEPVVTGPRVEMQDRDATIRQEAARSQPGIDQAKEDLIAKFSRAFTTERVGGAALGAAALASDDDDQETGLGLAATTVLVPKAVRHRLLAHMDEHAATPEYREVLTPAGWGARFYRDANITGADRNLVVARLDHFATGKGVSLLRPEDVRTALANPSRSVEPGRGFFRSRLTDAVKALPKAWDAARPAADWIGKLTGSEASKFSKQELGLIRNDLDTAAKEKRKISRSEIIEMLDERVPQMEQVTLSNAEPDDPTTLDHLVRYEPGVPERAFGDIENDMQQGRLTRQDIGHQMGLRREQMTALRERRNELTDRLREPDTEHPDLPAARERYDDAEAALNRAHDDLPYEATRRRNNGRTPEPYTALQVAAMEGDNLDEHIDNLVQHVMENEDGPEIDYLDLIQSNGYKVEEDLPGEWVVYRPARTNLSGIDEPAREIKRYPAVEEMETGARTDREGNPLTEEVEHDEPSIIEKYRSETGDTDDIEVEHEDTNEARILDSDGDEVWRGDFDDRWSAAQDIVSDNSLDQEIQDEFYQERRRPIETWANAVRDYYEAEREVERLREEPVETEEIDPEERRRIEAEHEEVLERLDRSVEEQQALRAMLARAPESLALLPATTGGDEPATRTVVPKAHADTEYQTYQRIDKKNATNYRELPTLWSNPPEGERAYEEPHTWPKGVQRWMVGHIRAEDHHVHDLPEVNDRRIHVGDDDDSIVASWKRQIMEKRANRDKKLEALNDALAGMERLEKENPVGLAGLKKQAAGEGLTSEENEAVIRLRSDSEVFLETYNRVNQEIADIGEREDELIDKIAKAAGATKKQAIAVMLESQSHYAADAVTRGVRPPVGSPLHAERAAKLKEARAKADAARDVYHAADEAWSIANSQSEALNEEWHAWRSGINEPLENEEGRPRWGQRVKALGNYIGDEDAISQLFTEHPEAKARFDAYMEKSREIDKLSEERAKTHREWRALADEMVKLDAANRGDEVPWSPFLSGSFEKGKGGKYDVDTAGPYRLNAARFLIDSAERNHERIAWSDAANRAKFALHTNDSDSMTSLSRLKVATQVYDNITPSAIRSMLGGLGFKDVKIEHIWIKGWGHWSVKLTPEMRKAIRTVGLPILGLLGLAATPDEAEAQDGEDRGRDLTASDAATMGAVGLAASTLGVHLYRQGLRAALADIAKRGVISNPLVLGALGTAMMQVPDDDFENFGKGVVGLAALKAVGSERMGKAGGKVGKMVVDAAKSWGAQGVVRAFSPEALLTPEVLKALQTFRETSAKGTARAAEQAKKLSAKGGKVNRAVTDVMRGENWEGPLAPADAQAALTMAMALTDQMEEVGLEKVGQGIITPEQYNASGGASYLPRIYAEFEAEKANPALSRSSARGEGRPIRMSEQRSRTLDDLPPDERDRIRNELGEVRESSYLASAALSRGWRDVGVSVLMQELRTAPDALHPSWVAAYDDLQMGKLLLRQAQTPADKLTAQQLIDDAKGRVKDVTRKFETRQGDYVALPSSEGLGDLAGAVVQRDIALSVNGLPDVPGIGGLYRFWKQSKTVWNPGTHIANVAGNMTMLHMAGLPLTQQPKWLNRALDDLANYGDVTRDLTEHGILNSVPLDTSMPHRPRGGPTFGDLLALRDDTRPETADVLRERGIKTAGERLADRGHPKAGDLLDRTAEGMERLDTEAGIGPLQGVGARKVAKDAQQLYQNEDNVFRVAAYLWRKGEGDTDKAAREFARDELINFHTRSPLLHIARNTIAPFALFPAKALPTFARHLVDHPERWITVTAALLALNEYGEQESGYDFGAGDIPERDRTSGFGPLFPELIQLPMKRDKKGGVAAIDAMRWTPGQAVTQGAPEHSAAGRLGLPSLLTPTGPIIDIGTALGTNTDAFSGKRITEERGSAALPDYLEYAAKEMLPTAATLHAPRFAEDLEKANYPKAATDALGFVGARPRYFQPGEGARRAHYEYDDYTKSLDRSLKSDLRESQSPEYSKERRAQARVKHVKARQRLREQVTSPP